MCNAEVCVRGWSGGFCGCYTPFMLPPPSKRLYKGDGGRSTFVTLLSDTETITLSLDTQTLWTLAFLRQTLITLRKELLLGTGFSPWWAFWLDWKRREKRHSWNTLSITGPVWIRATGTLQTFGKLRRTSGGKVVRRLTAAQPWGSSTCSTCSCCLQLL